MRQCVGVLLASDAHNGLTCPELSSIVALASSYRFGQQKKNSRDGKPRAQYRFVNLSTFRAQT
jgi:hypothetical protein